MSSVYPHPEVQAGSNSYTYDALGNLVSQKDAKGQQTCLAYDLNNRLVAKNFILASQNCGTDTSGWPVKYTYDEGTAQNGYRTGMTDPSGSTSWSYDLRGRISSENKTITDMGTYTTLWSYNSLDQVKKMTYSSGEVITYRHLPQDVLTKSYSIR